MSSTNTGTKGPYDKTQHSKGFSEDSLCLVAPEIDQLLVPGTVDCAYFRCDNEDAPPTHTHIPRRYL